MNEENEKKKPPDIDRETYLAEIERLYIEGLKTRETAASTLLDFTRRTKPDYRVHWHHKALAKMLDRVARLR